MCSVLVLHSQPAVPHFSVCIFGKALCDMRQPEYYAYAKEERGHYQSVFIFNEVNFFLGFEIVANGLSAIRPFKKNGASKLKLAVSVLSFGSFISR